MRPIKLVMTAFGPYAHRTELEMDKLGEKGLYLICGETGAGKTTIFDAISYALYGEASGNYRDASMLRSKYADSKTPTEVELTFLYDGEEYYIKRSPQQRLEKTKGNGLTDRDAEVCLRLPDKRELNKKNEVKTEINRILGIDADQFSQIAMIAQGDFYDLLFKPTSQRKDIFRKLFRTSGFEKFQNEIHLKYVETQNCHKEVLNSIGQYIGGVSCDSVEEEFPELERLKENGVFGGASDIIKKLVDKDTAKLEANNAEMSEIDKKLAETIEILAKAEEYEKAQKELETVTEKEKSIAKQIEEYESTVRSAENREVGELSELANKITLISDKLSSYDELDSKSVEYNHTEKCILNAEKELARLGAETEVLSKSINEKKSRHSELENAGENKANFEKVLVECNHSLSALEMLNKEYDEIKHLYSKVKSAVAELERVSNDAEKKRKIYTESHKLYIAEQAGIIAEELADGKECPVCGSKSHPNPAVKSEGAPTKEQIESNRLASENADKVQRDASEKVGAVKATYEARIKNAKDKSKELVGTDDLKAALPIVIGKIGNIRNDISLYKDRIKEENLKIDEKQKLDIEIPSLVEKLTNLTDSANRLNNDLSAQRAKKQALETEIGNMKSKLEYESKSVATAELNKLRLAHTVAKNEIDKIYELYSDLGNNHSALKGQHEALTKRVSELTAINAQEYTDMKVALEKEKARLTEFSKDIGMRLAVNTTAYNGVKEKTAELIRIEKELVDFGALANTAMGKLKSKERLDFETYIQAYYFEKVIESANKRLEILSDGVYKLVRVADYVGGNSKSGLDLNIIERGTSSERSVKSLSGGESFEASLALALGLSDVIQSAAGGIRLDTMFIDEGFGTLSDKHLERALKALSGLSDGNRLVGIISHVGFLNESIDKKIVVKKLSDGTSTATIETD